MEFYRYEFSVTVSASDDDRLSFPLFRHINLYCNTFYLVKETPKGYWIDRIKVAEYLEDYRLKDIKKYCRWIPKKSKKRYAYPTKQEALNYFIKRTEKYKRILKENTWPDFEI